MNIIFNAVPFDIKTIDPDWEGEYLLAKKYGIHTHLIDYEALIIEYNFVLMQHCIKIA